MKALAIVLATVSVSAAAPAAPPGFERFAKQLSKYATPLGGEPRGLCVCRDTGLSQSVGYLLRGSSAPIEPTQFVTLTVSCHVPSFDENTGEPGSTFVCQDFVPMVR